MTKTDILSLESMHFFAYHGFYDEEAVIGGDFTVDVTVQIEAESAATHDDLQRTLNYETIYNIVKEEMSIPRKLIETLAYAILYRLRAIQQNGAIKVKISKLNPPLPGSIASSSFEVLEA